MAELVDLRSDIQMLRKRIKKIDDILDPSLLRALEETQNGSAKSDGFKSDQNTSTKEEIKELITNFRVTIGQLNKDIDSLENCGERLRETVGVAFSSKVADEVPASKTGLSNDDISRFSRQIIMPGFGVTGQIKLQQSSFLVVGVGGLGCPAAQYLVASGCGQIGLIDYDFVERSNFHRQTLYTERCRGLPKVQAAKDILQQINPRCQVDVHHLILNSDNALALLKDYDVILDCTDNVASRYLLNDACVMLNKPLVSGSALQLDGQLTVYNYGDGPCYRCLFPVPPPPETVTNCGDGGVLGAVTGAIGSLQALEATKVAVGLGDVLSGRLLIFDGNRCVFRNIKLRPKRAECDVCSAKPLITRLINYEQFCGMHASDKDYELSLLHPNQRISVVEYKRKVSREPHVLLDVRSSAEFEICQLPRAINVPLKEVLDDSFAERFREQIISKTPFVVCCRRGNDSQIAVHHIQNKHPELVYIKDILGGLHEWHHKIDNNFPIY